MLAKYFGSVISLLLFWTGESWFPHKLLSFFSVSRLAGYLKFGSHSLFSQAERGRKRSVRRRREEIQSSQVIVPMSRLRGKFYSSVALLPGPVSPPLMQGFFLSMALFLHLLDGGPSIPIPYSTEHNILSGWTALHDIQLVRIGEPLKSSICLHLPASEIFFSNDFQFENFCIYVFVVAIHNRYSSQTCSVWLVNVQHYL